MQLVKYNDKILSTRCEDVSVFDSELQKTLSEMAELMYSEHGVGLAAPQIGIAKNMLVADLGYVNEQAYGSLLIKMINPKVKSYSEETTLAAEGCLSFKGLAVQVKRPVAIRVEYQDELGQVKEEIFKDWQARIIMHELDHLDGVTLYSRSSNFARKNFVKKYGN